MKKRKPPLLLFLLPLLFLSIFLKESTNLNSSIEYRKTCDPQQVGVQTIINGLDTCTIISSLAAPGNPSNLFAFYPFDFTVSNPSIAMDQSGYNIHIPFNGPTPIEDRFGKSNSALHFDGNDNLTIPHNSFFETPPLSLSFWFRKTNNSIIDIGNEKLCTKGYIPIRMLNFELKESIIACDTFTLQVNSGDNENGKGDDSLNVQCLVSPYNWHHVVATFNQITTLEDTIYEQRLYFNGIGVDSFFKEGAIFAYNYDNLVFSSSGNDFTGDIDDIRLYNRKLKDNEIQELYSAQSNFICPTTYTYEVTCDPTMIGRDTSYTNDSIYVQITGLAGPIDNQDQVIHLPLDSTAQFSTINLSGSPIYAGVFPTHSYINDSCGNALSAIHFDQDIVDVVYDHILDATEFSTSFWFKKTNDIIHNNDINPNGPNREGLVLRGDSTFEENSTFAITISKENTPGENSLPPFDLGFNVSNFAENFTIKQNAVIYPDKWYHVVATFSESNSCQQLFLNGDKVFSCAFEGALNLNSNYNIRIGTSSSASATYFNGDIDEFRYYNRIVTDAEVQRLGEFQCNLTQIDTAICENEIFEINGSQYTEADTFDVALENIHGCDSLVRVYLSVLQNSDLTEIDTVICENEIFEFDDSQYTEADTFDVVLKNIYSCDSLVRIYLSVSQQCDDIEIFNPLLTPNEDGFNEEVVFDILDDYPNNLLTVFNRYGQVVFEASPYDNTWKGTSRETNETLPDGTYYYILELGDGQKVLKGYITLLSSKVK